MNGKFDTSQLKKFQDEFNEKAYRICYLAGVHFVRTVKSIIRFTRTAWRPIFHGVIQGIEKAQTQRKSRSYTPSVRRWPQLVNALAPVAALAILLGTAGYWGTAEFALSLKYGDTDIGYIKDEIAYASAAAMVRGSVINANNSFTVERAPKLAISVMKNDTVLTEEEICDRILDTVSDQLQKGVGVYADDKFLGALPTRKAAQAQMETVLSTYDVGRYDGVGFFADVTLVEGTYPVSAFVPERTLSATLGKLTIQTYKNKTYTETVKYSTVYVQDTSLPLGYETVIKNGVSGRQRVHAQTVYVDGKEVYETVTSVEILQEPVDRVVKIGAQTYTDSSVAGDGVATGKFIWPLPYTKQISSYFASRWGSFHGAIDIANGSTNGKPIIASDGGTVIKADYHGSYGYFVLIDHGNGFQTRYAHCSKLNVQEGEKVAQGQYIANVGNTGYSFGAHLHFEVIKNGALVDPLDYVQR